MQLFLDHNKTLIPRIDTVYLLARVMILGALAWLTVMGDHHLEHGYLFYAIVGTFVAQLVVFGLAVMGKFDIKLAYLSSIVYDLMLLPAITILGESAYTPFFMVLFLTAAVAAYVLSFPFATLIVIAGTGVYVASALMLAEFADLFDVFIRVGFMWVFFLAIAYASEYLHRSGVRLMKLFDTLNLRTSELEKSQAELEVIYENSRALASILDTDGVVREIVRILGHILHFEHFAMILRDNKGRYYYQTRCTGNQTNFHPSALNLERMELIKRVGDVGEAVRVRDVSKRDDYEPLSERARSLMAVPMVSRGEVRGILTAESDITDCFSDRDLQMLSIVARAAALALDNADLHRRTEELTIMDELTEIYNYRYFIKKLQEEKRRAARYHLPLSIIMIDIDWFKRLNDSYGHEVGNVVLKRLAQMINSCIRDVDISSRYGGEEFVVILPQTPLENARNIGERIRRQVESTAIKTPGIDQPLYITVSVGVSSYPENGKSEEELVSIADRALYQAKGEGKNLVCTT